MNTACLLPLMLAMSVAVPMLSMADEPQYPTPWVCGSSGSGRFFFKMVPAASHEEGEKTVIDRAPFGVAYEVAEDGQFKEIWRAEGWYVFSGHLSWDGRYLVGMGPWPTDQAGHTDLAIAFYDRGVLLKQYRVCDLIKKPESIEDSVSHYDWHPEKQTKPDGFDPPTFHLVMIDKTSYDFDYETGSIVKTGTDPKARSSHELMAEQNAAAAKRGSELFNASPIKESFIREFEVSDVSASGNSFSGCSLQGDTLEVVLTPREKLGYSADIHVLLPIVSGTEVKSVLSPGDYLIALKKTFSHPFVAGKLAEGNATGIRFRMLGDRLHWNTSDLAGSLKKLTGKTPPDEQLFRWAYFLIDFKGHETRTGYLDTQTGEIVYEGGLAAGEDLFNRDPDILLLDAQGKQIAKAKAWPR